MRYTFGKQYTCFYCGEPADCIDHTIPYSWFRDTKTSGQRQQESVGFMTYSCRECNQILGDKIFPTIQDRLLYVHKHLRKRHKKEMNVVWDNEDLSTVSGRLQEYINQQNNLNLKIRTRLAWITSPEFNEMIQQVYEEVYYNTQIPPRLKEYFIDTDYEPVINRTAIRNILPKIPT